MTENQFSSTIRFHHQISAFAGGPWATTPREPLRQHSLGGQRVSPLLSGELWVMHTFTPSLCCSHPGESKAGRLFRGPVRLTLIHSPSPPRPPPLSLSSSVSISGWPKIEKAAIAGTGLPLTGRIQGWGGRGGGFQPGCGCRVSLEAPLRGCRGGARFLLPSPPVFCHSQFQPSFLLRAGCRQGAGQGHC